MRSMDESPDNPGENQLPAGITDAQVDTAVASSGYPLQTVVASILRQSGFDSIAEEWVYSDADTGELRALDLRASKRLYEFREPQPYVRPAVELLVECKRSELPFVFFASENLARLEPGIGVVGLPRDALEVISDDTLDTTTFSVLGALELERHAFLASPHQKALAFSKVVRKGKDLVLSGVEAYQGIVLPLVKAGLSLAQQEAPVDTAVYFDVALPVRLAVLDGPMLLASVDADVKNASYSLTPWVRVYRHDIDPTAEHQFERARLHAIDCVHRGWLTSYLEDHLIPFAREFGQRSLAHHEEVASGKGFAPRMGQLWGESIESRLVPRRRTDATRRAKQVGVNVVSLAADTVRDALRSALRPS
jgi:hypothetical protein